jgi:TRAP-type mannitol/chloroaromatic compound transport system permease large subunit
VIFVGALLAATTGVVAASVIAMGLISLPIMLRYGYDRTVATGIIAASGTLAQIIPPSLVLIVLADQLGRSVGDMYEGRPDPRPRSFGLYIRLRPGHVDREARIHALRLPLEARTQGPWRDSRGFVAFIVAWQSALRISICSIHAQGTNAASWGLRRRDRHLRLVAIIFDKRS